MQRILLGVVAAFFVAASASAQEQEIERSTVPRDLADRLIGVVNDPATLQLLGDSEIPADSVVRGDVVVMGGFRLGGLVVGEVIVVSGDVELLPGAEITGGLTVVDGELRGSDVARVGGAMMAFQAPAGRLPPVLALGSTSQAPGFSEGIQRKFDDDGRSGFRFQFGEFNRLEGFPIAFGPGFTTAGRNPFRLDAQMVWRTEGSAPFQTDRLGYRVEGEQFIGGRREFRVGGSLFSSISPMESWGLSDIENSLSAFVFTSDQRDYLETRGGEVFLRATPRRMPIDLRVGYRDERVGSVATQNPWSVFRRGQDWRAQPVVAEGRVQSVVGQFTIDTRDHLDQPRAGWLLQATWQEQMGGNLTLPATNLAVQDPSAPLVPVAVPELDRRFATAFLDVRRYQSLGRGNQLNLRGVIGGSPSNEVLPPQAQLTLGGPGTLPGHRLFAADCGARSRSVVLERDGVERPMYPSYGCDRMALFQAEYRGSLGGFFGWDSGRNRSARRGRDGSDPRWVVFFDAGRAWAAGNWGDFERVDSPTLYDAGIGILLGGIGVYWAQPLGEADEGSRFTVRLDRRF